MPSSSSLTSDRVLRDDLALVHDEDPVRERQDLLELERDEEDRPAPVSLLDEPPVDELDRTDVEPSRRLRGDEDARIAVDLAGEHDLLLVAAGERARPASAGPPPRTSNSLEEPRVARSTRRAGNSQPKREFGC